MSQYLILNLEFFDLLKLAGTTLAGLSIIYIGKIIRSYSFFKSRGIPTPDYKLISGNHSEIVQKSYTNCIREWTQKYGKIYGYYEGHLPVLVTSDLDLIQDVFVNKFSYFTARKFLPFSYEGSESSGGIFQSSRNKWKRLRTIINPTFSPSKLKQLIPLLRKCSDRFIFLVEKDLNKEINLQEAFNNMAMDVAWNCGYGIDIDCQNKPDNPYLNRIKLIFEDDFAFNYLNLSLMYFNELKPIIMNSLTIFSNIMGFVSSNFTNPIVWLNGNIRKILEKRQNEKIHRKDYVQILLDALTDNIDKKIDGKQYDSNNVIIEKKIDFEDLLNNLGIFLFAGMDTVSSTLSNCIYFMMKYPEEMRKLQEEIDCKFDFTLEKDDDIYENIKKLEYLDMFIKEVSRLHPVAMEASTRRCTNRITLKGIDIPEDTIIAPDVISLHYDPAYWGEIDPNVFYPLRFSPEYKRNKLAYMPFGHGPMMCVGVNFALLEIKLLLAKLLLKYDVEFSNQVEPIIEFGEGGLVRKIKGGLKCVFKTRYSDSLQL